MPGEPLRGRAPPWGIAGAAAIAALVIAGLWLRTRGLAVDGFADDEVHKWLAANRYLHGDFGGDDVEHPMLMKWLIAFAIGLLPRAWAPEAVTRLPNAIVGGLTVWAVALLARRLYGRAVALVAAGLTAFSTTLIGYQRIAKEDTLIGLFTILALWCVTEAKAASTDGRDAARARWELGAAAAMGVLLASKYYLSYALLSPLGYLALRSQGGAVWRIPARRWATLVAVAFAVFAAIDWTPFMPSTWEYFRHLFSREVVADRSISESYLFMGRLWSNMAYQYRGNVPAWYFLVFAAVKYAPSTAALALVGTAIALWTRAPAHRIVLVWVVTWAITILPAAAKYARLTVSVQPALLVMAAFGCVEVARFLARLLGLAAPSNAAATRWAVGALGAIAVAAETRAAVAHAPHYRLYVNAIGGGDRNVTWFFPHCDFFDAGAREAIGWIAVHAEPGAEIASEIEWPVQLYAERAGRTDLRTSTITPARGCRSQHPCYVLVQTGRLYRHNQAALEHLATLPPAHVVHVDGYEVAKVYRLDPGAPLFPAQAAQAR